MAESSNQDGQHHNPSPVLSVHDLRSYYPIHSEFLGRHIGDVKAVDGVSLDLYRGETVAIVGESGCGKSTLAETLIGLQNVTGGRIEFLGRDVTSNMDRSFRREVQMIFQDPFSTLNERMSVGRIVTEPLIIHDERKGERE
ncbi:MAG: ATP-binding cassette domain-containing protein, partial [Halobacteriaceae archaeon]